MFTNIYPKIISDELFETVRSKIESNKYGKHKPDVVYLLKNKLKCGYCDHTVNSDAGTSKSGKINRYYKCSGKRTNKNCPLKPIRKELLEDVVVQTILKALGTNDLIKNIADKIISINEERIANDSTLSLLSKELDKVENSISNVLSAIDKGIITSSTKAHLEELENKKKEISEQIAIEATKERMKLTREDVVKYMKTAITKSPKQMIDLVVKNIILYNDKLEIFFKYNRKQEESNEKTIVYSSQQDITIGIPHKKIDIDINCLI